MNQLKFYLLLFVFFIISNNKTLAQLFDSETVFTKADTLRGTLSKERNCFDVTYYHLDIMVDIFKRQLSGYNEISFKVTEPTRRIQLDLFENMKVEKVVYSNKEIKFTREFNAIFIDFNITLNKNATHSIKVYYSGSPQQAKNAPWDGGFTYTTDKDNNQWVAVSCQGTGASCWWPLKDHQSDEPDSMLISIACPEGYMDISNGRLRSVNNAPNGYKQFNWFVGNPINSYNVTLNIGKFVLWADSLGDLTLDYYVLPYNLEKSKKQFEQVKNMLICFEKYFGKYPFKSDGYKLVETPYLGMEHQSAIAYGNKYMNGYLGRSISRSPDGTKFDYIIVHESAHEWWGNNITTADIADMWVHEGFAMYAEALYCECNWGYDSYLTYINGVKFNISNDKPIIGHYGVNNEGSGDMYYKGALMIHTIRTLISNDSLFFSIIKSMQKEFYHSIVTSAQIEQFISKQSGKDFSKIFEQYLRHSDPPRIIFNKTGDKVQYRWKTDVEGFDMPLKLKNSDGTYTDIFPTTQDKILEGYSGVENIKVATDLYYVKVTKE